MGLVDAQEVFGDAVNVAARVETLAAPDQILVSEAVYREVASELGADLFLPIGPSTLKGKLERVVIYEVIWSPEQTRLRTVVRGVSGELRRVLYLEVSRFGARAESFSR